MLKYTVLVQERNGEVWIFPSTFGHYTDEYLWNKAWCREHFDLKTIGPEGRNWIGTVNSVGIKQLRDLGYSIDPARVVIDK